MALVDNTSIINSCESVAGWPAGGGAPSLDADIRVEGANSLGYDVDIATEHVWWTISSGTQDWTGATIYMWMLCMTSPFLDTSANGGIRIVVRDSSNFPIAL